MNRITTLTIVSGLGILLGSAGCSGPTKRGIEARKAAVSRFDAIRSRVDFDQADQAFRAGDLISAKRHLDVAISKVDDDPAYWVLLGRVYLENGSLGDAAKSFDRAHEIDPRNADACYFQGIVDQRLDRANEAVDHYLSALEIAEENAGMLVAAVDTLIGEERFEDAERLLKDKGGAFRETAAIHHLAGRVAMFQENWGDAVDHLDRAVLLDDEDQWMLEDLARAQLGAHRTSDCLETIKRLEGIVTDRVEERELLRLRGRCLVDGGRLREAREVFLDFTNLNPEDVAGWIEFGLVCLEVGDHRRVVKCGQRLVVLGPDRFEGYFLLGQAALEERSFDDAITLFGRASEIAPDRDEPRLALGMACELAGRYAEAYRAFAELAERNPTDPRVRKLLTGVGESLD
ncbi:MAG: hypothetical protein CMJ52_03785 [Planctomycetaceae bacterium]|nr:hypothetical protein [Planctomycetaceae bacterium]